jgi:hypothetical protein
MRSISARQFPMGSYEVNRRKQTAERAVKRIRTLRQPKVRTFGRRLTICGRVSSRTSIARR